MHEWTHNCCNLEPICCELSGRTDEMNVIRSQRIWLCLTLTIGLELSLTSGDDLKIIFWIEPVQRAEFEADIAVVLKELETLQVGTGIVDAIMQLTHTDDGQDMENFCDILNSVGSTVIVDLSYSRWTEGEQLARTHGIGYVRVGRIMRPFLEMFGDFMRQKRANNVAMIFQNARDTSEAMQQLLDGYPFRTLILDASSSSEDFVRRLSLLRPPPTYYAMFARGSSMNGIFERVQKGQLFQRPAEWHLVFLDTRDRVFKYKRQVEFATRFTLNARAICRSMQMRDIYCTSGFTLQRGLLLDIIRSLIDAAQVSYKFPQPVYMDCNASAEVTEDEENPWMENVHWSNFIGFTPPSDEFNTQRIQQQQQPQHEQEMLEEEELTFVANISAGYYSNEHEAKTDLAIWSAGQLRLLNETISPSRRFFRVGTAESVPWSYLRRHPQTHEPMRTRSGALIWEGYCIDFIARLAEKLNFAYEIVAPVTGHMGERNEQGEWDGVIGDLISGETDFAVAALKMYSEREEVVDFLPPYFEQTGISIVMRKPMRKTSLFKFMTVLRVEVWVSIVAALIGTALMIWFMDKYSPYSSRNNRDAYPYECREFTLRESFWFALTSFTPQGGGEAPKAVSGRLLVAAYWLFVVLMLATFTANLAAFLTVERMQAPVQSLEQLARQSRINYTVVESSDTHHYFMNMKFAEDTLYRMWKEMALNASRDFRKFRIWDYPIKEQYGHILLSINSSKPVRNASEGFATVDAHGNADYAFIHDSAEIKYEVTRNCNLTEVGEVFAEQPYAVAVQQGSHLGDELSYAILELQKERFFEQLRAKYWNQSKLQDCPLSEDQEGITLESLGGVFIATLFGLIMAMVTLGFEIVYYQKKQKALALSLITQVRPMNMDDSTKIAWLDADKDYEEDLTKEKANNKKDAKGKKAPKQPLPAPAIEAGTFRGKKMPVSITLGDGKFKPRPRDHINVRRNIHSGYME
ncbi:ionotropic receptor 25a [Drosophila nasuta]|uniref:ionotropic receptor 25a n=1 Tax=Drosophila nasuta TaxID=42062 RepID=UPI00295F27DF|nr:ionotropic receptor 25a [Drosophila nasuta]